MSIFEAYDTEFGSLAANITADMASLQSGTLPSESTHLQDSGQTFRQC